MNFVCDPYCKAKLFSHSSLFWTISNESWSRIAGESLMITYTLWFKPLLVFTIECLQGPFLIRVINNNSINGFFLFCIYKRHVNLYDEC